MFDYGGKMRSFLAGCLSLFFAVSVFANLNDDYELLKDSGTDFQVIGVVCEQVARLELYEVYPAERYEIHTGIQYAADNHVKGELDVVVIDRASDKAVLLGEVKCWKNLEGAYNKAMKQRRRFLSYINSNAVLQFRSTTTGEAFRQEQFEGIKNFISIAQKGGESAGFTRELDYSLEELMSLRQRIMECQRRHECAAPAH